MITVSYIIFYSRSPPEYVNTNRHCFSLSFIAYPLPSHNSDSPLTRGQSDTLPVCTEISNNWELAQMYASTTPLRYGGPDPVVQSTKHRYNQDRTMPSPVFFDKTTYCPVLPEENGQSMHSSPERSVRGEYDLSPTQTSCHDQYARGMGMSRQQADISLSQADLSATNYTTLPKSSTLDSAESQRDQAGQVSRHRDTSQSKTFGPSTPLKQSVPNHSSDEDHSSPTLKETCLRAKEIARLERETERIIGEERVRQLTRSQTPSHQTQTARIDGQKSIFKKIAFLSRTIPERLAENLPRSSASAPSRLRAFSGSASCPDRLNGSFEAAPPLYGIMRTERMVCQSPSILLTLFHTDYRST